MTFADDIQIQARLKAFEHQWDQAQLNHDIAALDRIMAEDFIAVAWGSTSTKAQIIESYQSTDIQLFHHQSTPETINVCGNTAIVIGQASLRGRYKDEDLSAEALYSRVYVRQEGEWKMLLAHATIR